MKKLIITILCAVGLFNANAQDMNAILMNIEENNLELKAARKSNAASIAEMKSENALGETSVEYSPFFQSGVSGIASSELIVSQEFDFPTLYAERRKQTDRQQAVLELEYDLRHREIMLKATSLCYDLSSKQQTIELITKRLEVCDSLIAICNKRLEHGDATILELNKLKVDRMALQKELLQAEGEKCAIEIELCRLSPSLTTPINIIGVRNEEMIFEDGRESQTADIALAEANVRMAEQDVKIARQGWLPKLTAGYRRNTEVKDVLNGMVVGASIPIFSNSGKIKAARLRQEATQAELENKINETKIAVSALRNNVLNLQKQLSTYDEVLLLESLSTLMRAVKAGEISIAEYYTEADIAYQLLQEHIDIQAEYNKMMAELRLRVAAKR